MNICVYIYIYTWRENIDAHHVGVGVHVVGTDRRRTFLASFVLFQLTPGKVDQAQATHADPAKTPLVPVPLRREKGDKRNL